MNASAALRLMDELEEDGVQLTIESATVRYRAPTGAMTPERLAALRAHRTEIMKVLRARGAGDCTPPQVGDVQDIWMPSLTARMAAQAGERVATLLRWHGALDLAACQVALDGMLKRHHVLRTRYVCDVWSALWAITEKHRSVPIELFDLSHLDAQSAEARGRTLAQELASQPFDIYTGPLLRLAYIKLADDDFVSVLVICHSIFDMFSQPLFFAEFQQLYQLALAGGTASLPPLPLQFGERARHLSAQHNGPAGFADLLYWRDRLSQLRKPIWLAPDRRSPPQPGAIAPPCIGQSGSSAMQVLRGLMKSTRCTTFVCALVITATVLAHRGDGEDAFFWISHTGRTDSPQLTELIGCFMDFAPFVMSAWRNRTFREACTRTRMAYEEALPHFHAHPRQLDPLFRRLSDRGPMSLPVLNYQVLGPVTAAEPAPPTAPTPVDWLVAGRYLDPGHAISLMFNFFDTGDSLLWSIKYKATEYEDATIERASALMARLLELAAAEPDARLSALLSEARQAHSLSQAGFAPVQCMDGALSTEETPSILHER